MDNRSSYKCQVCFGTTFKTVIERSYPRHLICRSCGFTFMENFKSLQGYYEEEYWNVFHDVSGVFDLNTSTIPDRSKKIFNLLKEFIKDDSRCLEIGAGFGYTLNHIKNNSKSYVFGIEPSKEGCQNMIHNKIDCFQGSIEEYAIESKFDIIILSHVFEHIPEPQEAIELIKRIMTDKAVIFVEVPNLLRPEFYKNLKFWFSKEHVYYYSLNKLNFFFNQAGLTSIYSNTSNVITTLFTKADTQSIRYSKEFWKVVLALNFHRLMYYPARVIRKLSKL